MTAFTPLGPRPDGPFGASQRGSAYLLALLVLVVLMVIGLSLAVITQTEVQIGAAEKSSTRVLYGADSGVRIQLAAYKTVADAPKARYVLDTRAIAGATFNEAVDVAPMLPMYQGPCSLCTQNYGSEDRKYSVNFVTNAQASRTATTAASTVAQANKLVTLMFFTQPSNEPAVNEGLRTFDPNVVADDPAQPGLDVIRY